MVYLNKTIFFKVPERVKHFTGEGVQFFPGGGGGGQMLIFPGGGPGTMDPRMHMIDPLLLQ